MNISEAIQKIKSVGTNNVRIVPMPNQPIDGDHQIDISVGGVWSPVVTGVKRSMAEDIVRQATNRVILG